MELVPHLEVTGDVSPWIQEEFPSVPRSHQNFVPVVYLDEDEVPDMVVLYGICVGHRRVEDVPTGIL